MMFVLVPVNPNGERRKIYDPLQELFTHVIKQAVDDYREGMALRNSERSPCRFPRRQMKRDQAILNESKDGRDFIYGDRLIRYLRILNMDQTINIQYFKSKAEESTPRKFNSI